VFSLFFSFFIISDTEIGPYYNPEILPPSAQTAPSIYGDTLYEDTEGKLYVIHLTSGAKIYFPTLWDMNRPFEILWKAGRLQFDNATSVSADVILSTGNQPGTKTGENEYTIYKIPGAPWGNYYSNARANTNEPAWQHLGEWPPSEQTRAFWLERYGVEDMEEELVFLSMLRSRSVSSAEVDSSGAIIDTLSFSIPENETAEIELLYRPLTESGRSSSFRNVAFSWAGELDINIDAEVSLEDLEVFEQWYESGSLKADWNEDGQVDSDDLLLAYTKFSLIDGLVDGLGDGTPEAGANANLAGCSLRARL
jgi:hypothetical protein